MLAALLALGLLAAPVRAAVVEVGRWTSQGDDALIELRAPAVPGFDQAAFDRLVVQAAGATIRARTRPGGGARAAAWRPGRV